MKKATILVMALIIMGVAGAGLVAAQGYGSGEHQTEMQEIMQNGDYQDLVDLREETGLNMKPWIQNQEDFEAVQESHQARLRWMEENGIEQGEYRNGFGQRHGNCPMGQR